LSEEETKSSYQKLRESYDEVLKSNSELTLKVNSLVEALEKEKAQKARVELIAKCNALNKEFKPSEDMSEDFLRGVEYAWSNMPKKNATPISDNGGTTPPPVIPKEEYLLDGKPIPPELKQFTAVRKDLEAYQSENSEGVM